MTRPVRFVGLSRSVVALARDQQLTFLAAAIAYYAFVSVFPLLLVVFAVATALRGEAFATQVLTLVGEFLTPQATTVLEDALSGDAGRDGATVVGLAILLWSGLRLFRGLDVAFSRIYGTEAPDSLVSQVRDALLVLVAVGAAVATTVVLAGVLPLVDVPLADVVGAGAFVVVLSAVFLPLYYVFPDRRLSLGEAVPGTLLASAGWTVLGTGFAIYAERALAFQLYGLVGGVLLVLTWFYVGGLLLLLGAALNAVLAGREDRQLQQDGLREGTQRMSEPEGPTRDAEEVATVEPESVDYEDFAELRRELERFEEEIEDRTVHRDELEADLQRYVRRRVRRGHARGWGPYLVLLYGTAMTLGAFYYLSGVWAVLSMVVVWLSTLGLYALMVVVGTATSALGLPGRILDRLREFRS